MGQSKRKANGVLKQIFGDKIHEEYKLTGSEVLIGRSPKSQICLAHPNISRKHCILTFNDGWKVKDNKSQNGTYVNGRKLEPDEEHLLQCNDIIFLGPPSELPQAFAYEEFWDCKEETSCMKPDDGDIIELPTKRACVQNIENSSEKFVEKISENLESDTSKKRPRYNACLTTSESQYEVPSKSTNIKQKRTKEVLSSRYHSNSGSESLVSKSKGADSDGQIYEISSTGNDHVENSESLLNTGKDDVAVDPFWQYPTEEYWELDTVDTYRSQNNHHTGKERELESKLALLSEQVKSLEASKLELLKNYEDVCEKNKVLDQQLAEKERKLEADIQMCEVKAKNEVKSELLGKFEEELLCNICTELFIKPSVLDCSHTFCEYCIKQWRKKKNDCPICRCKINTITRVRTLEEFIDKTLTSLTPDQRVKRDNIITERRKAEQPPNPDPEKTPRRRRNGGRQRHRHDRPNTSNSTSSTSIQILEERPGILQLHSPTHEELQAMHSHSLTRDGLNRQGNVPIFDTTMFRFFFAA